MSRIASEKVFHILKASGPMSDPTWSKVGGFLDEGKAKAKASAMAKADGSSRFYVAATVAGFRKAPEVEETSYDD